MLRGAFVVLLIALTIGCDALKYRPSREEIEFVETAVVLPEEGQLDEYARYYSATTNDNGDRTIFGVYIANGLLIQPPHVLEQFSPNVATLAHDQLPDDVIQDGGCSVVHISYIPRTGTLSTPTCNGVA